MELLNKEIEFDWKVKSIKPSPKKAKGLKKVRQINIISKTEKDNWKNICKEFGLKPSFARC